MLFRDADHAAPLFTFGSGLFPFFYRGLDTPTVVRAARPHGRNSKAERVACLFPLGMRAQILALILPLLGPGALTLWRIERLLWRDGHAGFPRRISVLVGLAHFLSIDDAAAVEARSTRTRARCSANPSPNPGRAHCLIFPAIGGDCRRAGIPLIVDNTTATPICAAPIEHCARRE